MGHVRHSEVTRLELRGSANVEHECTPVCTLLFQLIHVHTDGLPQLPLLPSVVSQCLRRDVANNLVQPDADQRADGFVQS